MSLSLNCLSRLTCTQALADQILEALWHHQMTRHEIILPFNINVQHWSKTPYCDNSYICSSGSGVSALLVYMALHPQITHRHCSKFSSVTPMSIWMSQTAVIQSAHRSFWFTQARWQVAVQLIGHFDSHRHVGKLRGSYTVSVCWIRLYHVSAHSPISLRW